MALSILLYPDPRLRLKAQPVDEITPELQERVREMFALMYKSKGIGLSAPQVGWSVRLFIMNNTGKPEDELVFINPKIVETGSGTLTIQEGCLSFPGVFKDIERAETVIVYCQDLDNRNMEIGLSGISSRCVLHEYDHLDGILLIDRL